MHGGGGSWLSSYITGTANFSAQYNFQSIAIVLYIMSQTVCTSNDDSCKDGIQQPWVEGTSSAVIFVGAVCGQLGMGYLGDYLSRSRALMVTLGIASIAAFLSAVAPQGSPTSVYSTIIAFRFALGVGLGGVFPLTGTKASEDTSSSKGKVNSVGSSWAFFWQVPGLLGPWLLGYIFTYTSLSISARWRIILGLGAIPSLFSIAGLCVERWRSEQKDFSGLDRGSLSGSLHSIASAVILVMGMGPETEEQKSKTNRVSSELVWKSLQQPEIQRKLLAAGGSWFIYDVMVYGLGLLSAYIIDAISSDDDNVSSAQNIRNVTSKQLITLSMSIPVTIFSIKILPYFGLRKLQQMSFVVISLLFFLMATLFAPLRDHSPNGLFAIYIFTSMSLNFGIGITTFSMPAALFPEEIRSTFNGFAAAMGKTGAIVGAYSFYSIAQGAGYQCVLGLCSGLALAGLLLTTFKITEEEIAATSAIITAASSSSNLSVLGENTGETSHQSSIDRTSVRKSGGSLLLTANGSPNTRGSFMIGKTTIILDDLEDGGSNRVSMQRIEPVVRNKIHESEMSTTSDAEASHVEL